jgi:hypothetical protein
MRLTVNLEPDLYALARSIAKADDCTISAAVNRLLRRSLPGRKENKVSGLGPKPVVRNGFTISRGAIPITPELVRQMEMEDDEA